MPERLSRGAWRRRKSAYLASLRARDIHLSLRGERWAVTGAGRWVTILGASFNRNRRWWLSVDLAALERRAALGVLLLCLDEDDGELVFGMPAAALLALGPELSRDVRGECKLNVVRRGDGYALVVPGQADFDLGPALGDLSWLAQDATASETAPPVSGVREPSRAYGSARGRSADPADAAARADGPLPVAANAPGSFDAAFFARITNGRLEPLDPLPIGEGELVLARITRVPAVPANQALRRIAARGGPDLPADFAERHDDYRRRGSR